MATLRMGSICAVRCKAELADPKLRLYIHHLHAAAFAGFPIILEQVSSESPSIFRLLMRILRSKPLAQLQAECEPDAFKGFTQYAAAFLANAGNYKSYGDAKFIPAISMDAFRDVAKHANVDASDPLLNAVLPAIYSCSSEEARLGIPPHGKSAYYSMNITQEDVDDSNHCLVAHKIEAWNTRLEKADDGSLRLKIASVIEYPPKKLTTTSGRTLMVTTGDHSQALSAVVSHLGRAAKYVENDMQASTIHHYVNHFMHGQIDDHKTASSHWVKDQDPTVESHFGFIETDRDPAGSRAEFEGFVAVVNPQTSAKFARLVAMAEPSLLPKLPWAGPFEKDQFVTPSFKSLEVVGFCSSGIPLGICLPNYDDIRTNVGFKNVDLGNIANSRNAAEPAEFLHEDDQLLFNKLYVDSDTILTGLHELIGHGSGKLLRQDDDGTFNFDKSLVNPLTNQPVATWYEPGETYGTVFGDVASAMEECRAELVSLYLCVHHDVQLAFETPADVIEDNIYVSWLGMCWLGLRALRVFDAQSHSWGQVHSRARFAILRALAEGEHPVAEIVQADGRLYVRVHRDRIRTHGIPVVRDMLNRIGIYRSTADAEGGRAFFEAASRVTDAYLSVHKQVVEQAKPPSIYVQPNSKLVFNDKGQEVDAQLVEYPATELGIIQSFLERAHLFEAAL